MNEGLNIKLNSVPRNSEVWGFRPFSRYFVDCDEHFMLGLRQMTTKRRAIKLVESHKQLHDQIERIKKSLETSK